MTKRIAAAVAVYMVCGQGALGWAGLTTVDGTAYPIQYRGCEVVIGTGGLARMDFKEGADEDVWGLSTTTYSDTWSHAMSVRDFGYHTDALWGDVYDGGFLTFSLESGEVPSGIRGILNLTPAPFGGATTNAIQGGDGLRGDPLCRATAWLYYRFATGQLPCFDGSEAAVAELQRTIWWLEGEITEGYPDFGTTYLEMARTAFGATDYETLRGVDYRPRIDKDLPQFARETWSGPYLVSVDRFEVYAVNVYGDEALTDCRQDCLFMIGNRIGGPVPEPVAALVWGAGAALLLAIRRV